MLGERAAYLDLGHYRRPGRNPLGNPKFDTVKQSPLVLPIYSFVHNRGCHGRMLLAQSRECDPNPNPTLDSHRDQEGQPRSKFGAINMSN